MFLFTDDKNVNYTFRDEDVQFGTINPQYSFIGYDCIPYDPVLIGKFNGINRFISFVKENMPTAKCAESSEYAENGDDFNAFASYDGALDVFINRPYTLKKLNDLQNKCVQYINAGNEIEYDVTGSYIDIGKFVSDEPECYGTNINGMLTKRVRLIIDIALIWYMQYQVVQTKCQRIAQLVDWLESNGVRTEIIIASVNECFHLEITIKKYDDPFNYLDILVGLHPELFRRLFFRFAEYSPSWTHGYGCSDHLTQYIKNLSTIDYDFNNNEHNILIGNGNVSNESVNGTFDDIINWCEQILPYTVDNDNDWMVKFAVD